MPDIPESKTPMSYGGIVVRVVVAVAATIWLWFWHPDDLSRLTNIVTVLAVAIPVVALFDTRLLTWIAARWSAAVAAAKAIRARNPWADFKQWQQHRAALAARRRADRDSAKKATAAAAAASPAGSPDKFPTLHAAAVAVAVGLSAAILIWKPWADPSQTTAVAEVASELPVPPVAEQPVSPPAPRPWLVKSTDRCWSMAQRCTGDWKRWVELGPLNGIDVSDAKQCRIVAGRAVLTPGDWPEGCLD